MAHLFWLQFVMTHEMCSRCRTQPQIRKAGIIRTSRVMAIKIEGPAHMVKDGHHHRKAPYRKCPNWSKTCFDLCDPDLWPLTLTFGMDITFVNGYYVWIFHEDTMRATFEKGVTDRRTDRQTERPFMKLLGRSWKMIWKNKTGKI